jgi:hypothetical protein
MFPSFGGLSFLHLEMIETLRLDAKGQKLCQLFAFLWVIYQRL